MHNKPVALVTGANKGIGLQIAKDLAKHGFTVLVGSRNLEQGETAAKSVATDAVAVLGDCAELADLRSTQFRIEVVELRDIAPRREVRVFAQGDEIRFAAGGSLHGMKESRVGLRFILRAEHVILRMLARPRVIGGEIGYKF